MAFVRQTQMGAGADEVRAYRQPQDRQGPRPRTARDPAWTRRQGDRIEMPFAAVHESLVGTKRTSKDYRRMSAVEGRADIEPSRLEVCV